MGQLAAVDERQLISARASLRNSPWRLLLGHFCPSPVAVRDGENAVKAVVVGVPSIGVDAKNRA
jgi:hypothetical protein